MPYIDKEKQKAYMFDYQKIRQVRDKEKIRLRVKAFKEANRERVLLQKRESHMKHREYNNEKSRAYRLANLETIKITSRKYVTSPKGRFMAYKASAKKRGHEFALTPDEFNSFIFGNCHYCGIENANGVDRIDSEVGYRLENAVSCCRICNVMKLNHSYELFINHIKKMANHINNPN